MGKFASTKKRPLVPANRSNNNCKKRKSNAQMKYAAKRLCKKKGITFDPSRIRNLKHGPNQTEENNLLARNHTFFSLIGWYKSGKPTKDMPDRIYYASKKLPRELYSYIVKSHSYGDEVFHDMCQFLDCEIFTDEWFHTFGYFLDYITEELLKELLFEGLLAIDDDLAVVLEGKSKNYLEPKEKPYPTMVDLILRSYHCRLKMISREVKLEHVFEKHEIKNATAFLHAELHIIESLNRLIGLIDHSLFITTFRTVDGNPRLRRK